MGCVACPVQAQLCPMLMLFYWTQVPGVRSMCPETHSKVQEVVETLADKDKGTPHIKKECFLSGIAQITPPPLPPIRATWSSFSDVKNDVLRV